MKKRIIIALIAICSLAEITAQNANTLYFMDEISTRNLMNPAFLPRGKSYFDFFLLPNIYLGAGENAFAIRDLMYNQGGKTVSALSSQSAIDKFLKQMPSNPYVKADFRLNLLNFGARLKRGHYLIFDFNLHADANVFLPRDLFKLALTGTPDKDGINKYDLSKLNVNSNVYATAGLGYSGRVHEKVTFGFKAKFLLGLINATTTIDALNISTSRQEWIVNSNGRVNVATPLPLNISTDENGKVKFGGINTDLKKLRPTGYGASFDIGLTYEPVKNLVISAAVVDLGFINWGQGYSYEGSIVGSYKYNGLGTYNPTDSAGLNTDVFNEIWKQMQKDLKVTEKKNGHTAMVNGKFNAGIEYGVLDNKISFGVMNQLSFNMSNIYDEVTFAFNFRPCQWIKGAISYSFLNGNWGTLGLGLNLNLGAFDLYLVSDYIPITWSQVVSEKYKLNMPLPDRLQYFNLQFGTIFNIGRFDRDTDDDGVKNYRDKCDGTDMDFLRKQCPKWKDKDLVDRTGCERDEDKDGVNDCYDQCPGSPEGVKVDSVGCPVDSDNDGVPDTFDECPETPAEAVVDNKGCPLDADGDGVGDHLDQCPNTPRNVQVDERGCPVDEDNDGVPDYLDKCLGTPAGIAVDSKGCPTDEDGDGVPDYIDQCQGTPRNIVVDSVGCPLDRDGDGIPDYMDRCPDKAGVVENDGCPELTELHNIITQAMNGIQFDNAKSTIKPISYPILDQMVAILTMDTTFNLAINGHTDNTGDPEKNMKLSEDRAAAVRQYFIEKGVNPARLTSQGFGDTQPIADNKTKKGREKNRRVEFIISYDRVTYEEQ